MKKTALILFTAFIAVVSSAQKKTTTSAIISFDATTPIDNLPKAENKTVVAAIDTKTGTVQFEAVIKNFAFSNPRIQEHFNNPGWMDSDNFPKATYSGVITNLKAISFDKNGTYTASTEGVLTIHGVEQNISSPAAIIVKDGVLTASASFSIKLSDFKINSPAVGAGKVSKEPKITVTAIF